MPFAKHAYAVVYGFVSFLPYFLLAQINRRVGSDQSSSQLKRAVESAQIPAAIMVFVCM